MTPNKEKTVTVTQAVRDEVADYLRAQGDLSRKPFHIKGGLDDEHPLVQLLARHREEAERDTIAGSAGEGKPPMCKDCGRQLNDHAAACYLDNPKDWPVERVDAYFATPPTPGIDAGRLRELLVIAVEEHDSHQGKATLPCHWTNQARALLGETDDAR